MPTTTRPSSKDAASPSAHDRSHGYPAGKPARNAPKRYTSFRPLAPAGAATEIIDLLNGYLVQHPAQSPADRLAAIKLMHEVKERLRALSPTLTAAHLAEAGEHFARKAQSSFAPVVEAGAAPTPKPRRA